MVDVHCQFQQRCLLESWHIRSQDAILKREEGNLPLVYNQLIVKANRPNTASGCHHRWASLLNISSPFLCIFRFSFLIFFYYFLFILYLCTLYVYYIGIILSIVTLVDTHTLIHSLSLSHTHTRTHSHTNTHTHTCAHTHTNTHTLLLTSKNKVHLIFHSPFYIVCKFFSPFPIHFTSCLYTLSNIVYTVFEQPANQFWPDPNTPLHNTNTGMPIISLPHRVH